MAMGWLGMLLLLGSPEPEPAPPQLEPLPSLPSLPSVGSSSESEPPSGPVGEQAPPHPMATLILDLQPRRATRGSSSPRRGDLHAHIHTAPDGELVDTVTTRNYTRELEPGTYQLMVGRVLGRAAPVKDVFALAPGQTVHLRLSAEPRVLLAVIGGVTYAGGLAMTLTGGFWAVRRGSLAEPGWDVRTRALFGAGLGTIAVSLVPIAFAVNPRLRVCRRSEGPLVFDRCDP